MKSASERTLPRLLFGGNKGDEVCGAIAEEGGDTDASIFHGVRGRNRETEDLITECVAPWVRIYLNNVQQISGELRLSEIIGKNTHAFLSVAFSFRLAKTSAKQDGWVRREGIFEENVTGKNTMGCESESTVNSPWLKLQTGLILMSMFRLHRSAQEASSSYVNHCQLRAQSFQR